LGNRELPKNVPITLACGDYEIVRALKEGVVEPDGSDASSNQPVSCPAINTAG
jgi:hypothetical protein